MNHYFLLLVAVLLSANALANERIYKYHKADGSVVFSNIKPKEQNIVKTLRFDCYACTLDSTIDWHNTPLYLSQYRKEISQASRQFSVKPALIQAVIHAESSFKPFVQSKVGAQGLMQLMPQTAKELGVSDPYNAKQNIEGGTQYLAKLLNAYNGDISLATAAYNAGSSNVKKYGGIPPFAETKAYVKRVKILHKRYYIASL